MTAEIFNFDQHKYITLAAVCHTCNQSWNAEVMKGTAKDYLSGKKKYICPYCQHPNVRLDPKIG